MFEALGQLQKYPVFGRFGNRICQNRVLFGLDDFCIEFWYRPWSSGQGYPSAGGIFLTNTNTSGVAALDMWDNGSAAQLYDSGTARGSWTPNYDAYNHIAVQRWNKTNYLFHNGVCIDTYDSSALDYTTISTGILLGMRHYGTPNNRLKMDFDELRITRGIPRYTPAGETISGIIPSTSTGAGSVGTAIPTSPFLRSIPFVAADGGRGFFANTNVKLWIKSDSYPGDTTFTDFAGSIGQSASGRNRSRGV